MKIEITSLERELIIDALSVHARVQLQHAEFYKNAGHLGTAKMFTHEHDLARELQKKINRQGK